PATERLHVHSSIPVQKLELMNSGGQLVKLSNTDQITVQGLPKGIYFLRAWSEKDLIGVERVVVQ
ncbi:MAG: T9SS type A sorting domain-containing protein, partial [Mameliella sp.]|nr:T9SS type A sorting domain-containing protein [Phaeodactylibacter sp.]